MSESDIEMTPNKDAAISSAAFTRSSAVATVIALGVLGPAVFLFLPTLLAAMYADYGMSEGQLGLFATVELLGMGLGAGTGIFWTSRLNWQIVSRLAMSIVLIGNLFTYMQIDTMSFEGILIVRGLIGLCAGTVMAVLLSFIAHHPQAERVAGMLITAQVTIQIIGLYLLPVLIASSILGGVFFGSAGIFLLLAILALMMQLFIHFIPIGTSAEDQIHDEESYVGESKLPALLVLLSFVLFFITQTSLWGFLELMGQDGGLNPEQSNLAIVLSTAIGVLGPLVAVFLGDSCGRFIPLFIGAIMQIAALILLSLVDGLSVISYLLYLGIFQFGWNLALPYQMGVMVQIDPSRRLIVFVSTAQAIGIALGPLIGGLSIEAFGYGALLIVAGVFFLAYCALILPRARVVSPMN